ncbi:hypothetical protein [Ramlibacter humi]|uniref:Uncharacterized protein n=1 Tax=Ramlibacter humi TaxID=2530451 RepID=A0A4Z0BXV9_9BURK|nr:hypothetical protein [Ramlibacter humi]TFZ03532.1 hypothetical protein EZ216_07620 [Ramlibacter humi]
MRFAFLKLAVSSTAVALFLAACGGGGGGSTAASSAQIVGTAATGAALAFAPVTITNSAGNSPCVETGITTTLTGSYTCTLKSGEQAPFFVVVTDPTGNTGALVSVTTTTPPAGSALTVNATPLTTAIVAQLAGDGNALSVVNARSVDAGALKAVTANVVAQLQAVLDRIGVPAGYDPFATSITAATAGNTGNTADLVLDVVKIVKDSAGKLALATIDDPTPRTLATATSSGTAVPAPSTSVTTLSQATQLVAQKLAGCFALPTSSRVLNVTTHPADQGGPEVDNVGDACEDFVSDSSNAAGIDFMHNGYYAGQFFYGLLTADSMTGATFSVPEVLAFYPASSAGSSPISTYDRAVLNIRYIDGQGNAGSVITVASRIPGSSSSGRPTEWWLTGNQWTVDIGVRMNLRRVEQLNSANTAKFSTFQTGVVFTISQVGPGSQRGGQQLTLARVTGPGLPAAGVVYRYSPTNPSRALDAVSKTGDLTATTLCNNGSVNCPNWWFERTAGVSGSGATTLASNPTGGTNDLIWAQSGDGFTMASFKKGAQYKFELFYGTNTGTADLTEFRTLLTDVVPATQAINLPWNTPGSNTLAALNPSGSLAGALSTVLTDWVQNPAAPQISGITWSTASAGFGSSQSVARGVTSATYANGAPAFLATTPPNVRFVLMSYRSGDSSNRSAVYTYN